MNFFEIISGVTSVLNFYPHSLPLLLYLYKKTKTKIILIK